MHALLLLPNNNWYNNYLYLQQNNGPSIHGNLVNKWRIDLFFTRTNDEVFSLRLRITTLTTSLDTCHKT